jgi:hypothetical protein
MMFATHCGAPGFPRGPLRMTSGTSTPRL